MKKFTALHAGGIGAFVFTAITGAIGAAAAQESEPTRAGEIVITASKRAQTLQEAPLAVSVVDAEAIERAQVSDLFDLQKIVPSLRVSQLQSSSQTNFIIRGFGNGANNPGIESSVGVFIDGVYRSRSAAAIMDLPVVERVEVLRGPQSTLFGKNVSVGAISIVTQAPEDAFGGSAELSYGNYNSIEARGTVTGPLGEKLFGRISGSYNTRDGYFDNLVTGEEITDRNRWSIRGDLLWEPSEKLTFRLIGDYNEIDEVCCGVVQLQNGPATSAIPLVLGDLIDPAGDTEYDSAFEVSPFNRLEGNGISLQADWDLGGAVLTSITAYRTQTDVSNSEIDFSGAAIGENPQDREFKTFTQEVRLASTGEGRVDWLIGGFFFNEDVKASRDIIFGPDARAFTDLILAGGAISGFESAVGLPAGSIFAEGTGYFGEYTMDNRAYSLFGQFDFHITDRLTFTGGLGYTDDKKEYTINDVLTEPLSNLDLVQVGFAGAFGALTGLPPTPANIAANPTQAATATTISVTECSATSPPPFCNEALALVPLQFFNPPVNVPNNNPGDDGLVEGDQLVYTARLGYDVSDDLNVYVTYSTGWKAAAVNLSSDSTPPDPVTGFGREASPEDVTLWEAGLKAGFDWGYVNLAIFDQTVEGFQSNVFFGTGFVLANAGEQSVQGVELETLVQPTDSLVWTFGLTYLDPTYDNFPNAPCVDFDPQCANGEAVRDLTGTTPAGISEITISTSLTYDHDFSDTLSGYVRGEYRYESDVATIENVPASVSSREVNEINASAGLQWVNGLELKAWVRNATDDTHIIQAFPTVAQPGSFSGYLNEPRTYGVSIRKEF